MFSSPVVGARQPPTHLTWSQALPCPDASGILEANSSSAALKRGIEEDLVIYAEASKRLSTRIRVDH